MTGRLHLFLCDVYRLEVRALPSTPFENVTFSFFDATCHRQPLASPDLQGLVDACDGCARGKVIGTTPCLWQFESPPSAPYPVETVALQQCLYLVAPRSLVEREQKDGAYCVTPGWLAQWQVHLDRWGFDRETAAAFFHESVRRVVLLDTLGDPDSQRNLEAFAAAVRLPHAVIPVGLEHFEATLTRIVRARTAAEPHLAPVSSAERQAGQADFALALDLLGSLFLELRSEVEAIQGVMDALKMLFAPDRVRVLAPREGAEDVLYTHGVLAPQPASQEVRSHFARCEGTNLMAADGAGFLFRLALGSKDVGIVEVDRVAFPATLGPYLNLALAMAPVCAAVIENARTHEAVRLGREALLRSNAELQQTNESLVAARQELRTLQEVLPVCAWCKRILDDQGAWSKLAGYLAAYTGARFSHGICEECVEKAELGG